MLPIDLWQLRPGLWLRYNRGASVAASWPVSQWRRSHCVCSPFGRNQAAGCVLHTAREEGTRNTQRERRRSVWAQVQQSLRPVAPGLSV